MSVEGAIPAPRPLRLALPKVSKIVPEEIGMVFLSMQENERLRSLKYPNFETEEFIECFPELARLERGLPAHEAMKDHYHNEVALAEFACYYVVLMFWYDSPYIAEPMENRRIKAAELCGYPNLHPSKVPKEYLDCINLNTNSLAYKFGVAFLSAQYSHFHTTLQFSYLALLRMNLKALEAMDADKDKQQEGLVLKPDDVVSFVKTALDYMSGLAQLGMQIYVNGMEKMKELKEAAAAKHEEVTVSSQTKKEQDEKLKKDRQMSFDVKDAPPDVREVHVEEPAPDHIGPAFVDNGDD